MAEEVRRLSDELARDPTSMAFLPLAEALRRKGQPELALMRVLLQRAPEDREAFVEHFAKVFELIGSPDLPRDMDEMREQAG